VSGGKDSTALLLLALERETPNLQAVFCDTGNEHQITYDYVKYLNDKVFPIRTVRADYTERLAKKRANLTAKWTKDGVPAEHIQRVMERLVPTGNVFLDMCLWHTRFPSTMARFCYTELKRDVVMQQINQPIWDAGDAVISWQGVRADESPARAKLPEEEDINQQYTIVRPILHWTADDCFAMHKKHNVDHNPLYSMGMGRVGCMPCIHARKDEIHEISKRFPEEIDRIENWEKIVSEVQKGRGSCTFFAADSLPNSRGLTNDQVSLESHGIRANVRWSMTSRGGKNMDLIKVNEPIAVCKSIYGLCE
jgi:3'-phosphoadenosine 5'-phosphosulfate sulfotransferase (PAPS reductase)/FAD synthetase